MGMFDYVNVKEENSLGILIGEYQTKELECDLNVYDLDKTLQFKDSKGIDLKYNGCMRLLNRDTNENVHVYVHNGKISLLSTKLGFHSYDLSSINLDDIPKNKAEFAYMGDDYNRANSMVLRTPELQLSNLDKVRKLVASGKVNESIQKYGNLFVLHINNRIEKLLKSDACKNGKITEAYYKLNNLFPIEITTQSKVNIKYWRNDITNDMNRFLYKNTFIGISNLEVSFLYLVRSYTLDLITLLFDLDISFDLLITDNLSTSDGGKVIIKKLFKKLETINKEITIMFKIAGYLKQLRIEQRLTTNHLYGGA